MNTLEAALLAARLAGDLIRTEFGQPQQVGWKGPADPVTQTDSQAEDIIIDALRREFPDHRFLAEEAHRDDLDAEYLWVIDPLDGTQNFARGIPFVSVSIALASRGQPILGVLHDPLRGEMIYALRGQGVHLNGRRVQARHASGLNEAVVSVGIMSAQRPTNPRLTLPLHASLYPKIGWTRSFGSTALELAYIACGRLDVVYQDRIQPWDILAGALLVQEAGGVATDFRGDPVSTHSQSIVAAARPEFHQTIMQAIHDLKPS
jgi:myo-inositol-1(or 4)-monophosphatase